MKEEIYKKMCAYYANDKKQLAKFNEFYKLYEHYKNDVGSFETIFISNYKTVYEQSKDEFEAIFAKYRVKAPIKEEPEKEEPIKKAKTITPSTPTEMQSDPTYALLCEMAKDVKKTSQWMQFVGIVVLIGVALSVITGIIAAMD